MEFLTISMWEGNEITADYKNPFKLDFNIVEIKEMSKYPWPRHFNIYRVLLSHSATALSALLSFQSYHFHSPTERLSLSDIIRDLDIVRDLLRMQ